MHAILIALVTLAQRTGRFTVAEATVLYNRLWLVLGSALFSCVVAFWMNVEFGLKWPSLVLTIVFAIAAIFLWAKPLNILIVAGAGLAIKVATHADLADGIETALKSYLAVLKWVLLVGVTFLFITGTISFKGNPGAILPFLVALSVIGLLTWMWPKLFVGTWGRKIIYGYAVLIAVTSLGSLIPGSVWVKYTKWDPATAEPTNTEKSLYRLNRAQIKVADADRATEIERITNKVNRHEALTQAEERFIVESQQSQAANASKPPAANTQVSCQDITAYETRSCIMGPKLSNGMKLADGPEANGKNVCIFPMMYYEKTNENGTTFWRFRTEEGYHEMKYRLFPAGEQCPSVL